MPKILLGSAGTCPLTGATGFVTKFVGDVPLYRTADGRFFKRERSIAGRPCRIRIRDVPNARWMAGERVTATTARVVEWCPVWRDAVVSTRDAEIVEA